MTPIQDPRESVARAVIAKFAEIIDQQKLTDSVWDYKDFTAYSGSIGPIGQTAGMLELSGPTGDKKFLCTSVDGGLGVVPLPFNFDVPLPHTPGGGLMLRKGSTALSANDFRGFFVALSVGAGCGPTVGVTYALMGAKVMPLFNTNPVFVHEFLFKILYESNALLVDAGASIGLMDLGATVSVGVCA